MKRDIVIQSFFLGLFLLALYQFFVIIEPFLTPLLGAMVLAIIAFPAHRAVCRLCPRWKPSIQAILSTLLIVTLIVIPFAGLLWLLINESANIVPLAQDTVVQVRDWYHGQAVPWLKDLLPLAHRLPFLSHLTGDQVQKSSTLVAGSLFGSVSSISRVLASNALVTTLNFFVMVFALFFLLRDGEHLLERLKRLLPLKSRDKDRVLHEVETTIVGVVRGSVLTALLQMFCATAGYFIVGIPAAVTLGVLTGLATVIPLVGSALIWLPTAIYLLCFTSAWKGIFLLIWGGVVISFMDNLIRTYLIGRQTHLPVFLLFIGLLGGLSVYGLRGLLIGPLLVAVIPVLLDIFEAEYFSEK